MKHLLSIEDLNNQDVGDLFHIATKYLNETSQILLGKTIINVFFENSTRTLTSFEIAAKKLGGRVINISVPHSSMKKGETIADTIATLVEIKPDFVIIRSSYSGVIQSLLNARMNCVFINAGDGYHEHPTQALIDAFTILSLKKKLSGLKVAICGDILHSRVSHSNIILLSKLGAEVRVISPPNLSLKYLHAGVKVFDDIQECLKDVDVIIVLRLQYERMKGTYVSSQAEYYKMYGIDHQKISYAKQDVIVMHPGPINRGVEISSEIADSDRHSAILKQVEFSIPMRQAVFDFFNSNI